MAKWVRRRSAKEQAATKRAALAAARPYARGQKIRRYESPKMIAQHGREPWPAKKAAAETYREKMRAARVGDRYPTYELSRHWSLKKANVGRDKRTGRFVKKR